MNAPVLSICIPTYNRARVFVDLLDSISREIQGHQDLVEIVVSDNCSTDDTREVVREFQSALNIQYSRRNRNIGITANIFLVPSLAKARYCWILGDDDMLVPGAIAQILQLLSEYPNIPAIVTGYSYQQESNRAHQLAPGASIEFENPVFRDLHPPKLISRWEDTFFETDSAALHTSIVSCVFARSEWLRNAPEVSGLALKEPLTSLETTFPHTVVWSTFLIGKPVVFAPAPLVYFFVGSQEWFEPKWMTILFSFGLELAQRFRDKGACEDAVRYYEALILNHSGLASLIFSPNDYAKEYFSLAWLIQQYGAREELWRNLSHTFESRSCRECAFLLQKIIFSCLRAPQHWNRCLKVTYRQLIRILYSCLTARTIR
ncbi:glycosyltransferase family 2 protein [Pseudomonadota bacterium]